MKRGVMTERPKTLNDLVSKLTADQLANFCENNGFTVEVIAAMLHRKRMARYRRAEARQKQVKTAQRERVVRTVNGSDLVMRHQFDPESYHYWGIREGYECWRDPQFLREYERDNPECAVKLVLPTTITAGIALSNAETAKS